MKRNDDGYVLPLVLVVLTVLALVAASVLSASLRNLQVQHKAADRMQDKYVAQGKIEKVVANLLDEKSYTGIAKLETTPALGDGAAGGETPEGNGTAEKKPDEDMCLAIKAEIEKLCGEYLTQNGENVWTAQKQGDEDVFTYRLSLKASHGTREITCQVELSGTMKKVEAQSADGNENTTYEAKELSIIYKEYQIGGAGE